MEGHSFLSADDCRALFRRIVGMTTGGGRTEVTVASRWTGTTRWLRNRVALGGDTQTLEISIRRSIRAAAGSSSTTRSDDAGLLEAVRAAEWTRSRLEEQPRELIDPFLDEPILHPPLWSEPTFTLSAAARTDLVRRMAAPAEAAGVFAAGALALSGQGRATMNTDGLFRYYPVTTVDCATTVRDAAGTASGWAGSTHHDLGRIDPAALSARALDKCRRGLNPKAVEPGRYTVILEPQAVFDLVSPMIDSAMGRGDAEIGLTVFSLPERTPESASKIGRLVIDRRLTVSADPMDAEAPFFPFEEGSGVPYRPVTWIERGVLKELAYDRWYAASNLGETAALPNGQSFRLSRVPDIAETPIEEMIASTKRGLLVTRFSNVQFVHPKTLLCTGFTRDGLWLIQNGAISMPVKNFRFTDSPMFALNSVDAIGPVARVYSPGRSCIVPALKVHEFNFTSLADAV